MQSVRQGGVERCDIDGIFVAEEESAAALQLIVLLEMQRQSLEGALVGAARVVEENLAAFDISNDVDPAQAAGQVLILGSSRRSPVWYDMAPSLGALGMP